jgi:hypothetical protein
MVLAHHRSLLRFGWRTGNAADRVVLPVVAVGLAVRSVILGARVALVRRGARRAQRRDRVP